MKFKYKIQNSYEQRTQQSFNLIEKHGQMIPVIIELVLKSRWLKEIFNKHKQFQKMIVRETISVQDLFNTLKYKYYPQMTPTFGIFIYVGGNKLLLHNSFPKSLKEFYEQNKDSDGWLYLALTFQECYG
ncbi:unnamed protein product (macronuclear) [Paramecium tetraurelia]|uniref:Autophagy-related protein n=1 Tax=Paramecium tetraurelia TaxID=5888 RepID=A0BIV2_PARTE|nr:uncharacterized protein GSPATT00004842001 [Paramecium tetraurelia]CAK58469.1 unnamed protein product [Paramecium tetraurelia]|eukprot:XP_001425867.1 hypothetical protein (macronuclear) [Paramecium tetraurelia strain d4-2]